MSSSATSTATSTATSSASLRIAIVGGGVGGTSTARFLRDHFGDSATLHLFEKTERIGGRIATATVDGKQYESGASVLHSKNKYMATFVDELKLRRAKTVDNDLGLFDGAKIVLETSQYSIITMIKMLYRYGTSVIKLPGWVDSFMKSFEKVYDIQQQEQAFTTVHKLLESLDQRFVKMTSQTLRERLLEDGFSARFAEELAQGIMRVNYGQNLDVGAFVGSVSLAGTGGELWCVENGNKKVPEGLLKRSQATVYAGVNVEKILGNGVDAKHRYSVVVRNSLDGKKFNGQYDMVFLCAPQDSNSKNQRVAFENLGKSVDKISKAYHRTVATFYKGQIDGRAFGKHAKEAHVPGTVLTTKDSVYFNSVGVYDAVDGSKTDTPVWKVFSQQRLSDEASKKLFPDSEFSVSKSWRAYPDYRTKYERERIPEFCVDGQYVFYVNAIEGAASAMEMSVIGAKNCVLLAVNKLRGTLGNIDPPRRISSKL